MSLEQPSKNSLTPLDTPPIDGGTPQNLSQFDLEYRRIEIENKRIDYANELLRKGLDNGAKAVYGAFFTFGLVFIMSFVAYHTRDKSFMSSQQILWLSGMLCVTLIIYFGFIFGYSLYLTADFRKKRLDIGSKKEP